MEKDYFSHLSPKERHILKEKGTEPPFSGEYNNFFKPGVFICRACKSPLYESNTKFNSGCGWPSFDDEIEKAIVRYKDLSNNKIRTEICCAKCNGHLGHVFHGEEITKKNTRHCVNSLSIQFKPYEKLEQATLGAGCFWGIDKIFSETTGVYIASVGYMGGITKNPTYKDVCKGDTQHAEVVNIYFNPEVISYSKILTIFWRNHNPTTLNKQGPDEGSQYRSIIFYYSNRQRKDIEKSILEQSKNWENPIVTKSMPASTFYRAEEYHQNYLQKKGLTNCGI